ncbi:MAG: NADP-dependent oxidoreductase [Roseiflexaceae bacterium]
MEQTMRAVGFSNYGGPEVLEMLRLPRPAVAADGVLVRVVAAGVNPADWRIRNGQFKRFLRVKLPLVLGSDLAGVVEQVGPAVTRFRPGDAVYAMLPVDVCGAYAEFAAVPERHLAHIPAGLSFSEAAATPLAGLTALQALRDKVRLWPNAQVLINGAVGGVGSFAVQLAAAGGVWVTGVCSGRNAALARSLGATEVIDYTQVDVTAGAPRFDVVFDTVDALPFRRWRRVLKPGGTLIAVNPMAGLLAPGWLAPLYGGRRVKSVFVQASGPDLGQLGGLIAAGRVRPLVERSYPLEQAAEAQRYSATYRVRGKLVLVVDPQLAGQTADALAGELVGG